MLTLPVIPEFSATAAVWAVWFRLYMMPPTVIWLLTTSSNIQQLPVSAAPSCSQSPSVLVPSRGLKSVPPYQLRYFEATPVALYGTIS